MRQVCADDSSAQVAWLDDLKSLRGPFCVHRSVITRYASQVVGSFTRRFEMCRKKAIHLESARLGPYSTADIPRCSRSPYEVYVRCLAFRLGVIAITARPVLATVLSKLVHDREDLTGFTRRSEDRCRLECRCG